jgi:hypothetical protein
MRRQLLHIILLIAATVTPASAQNLALRANAITGGGGVSSNGGFTLVGAIAPIPSALSSGGPFSVAGGLVSAPLWPFTDNVLTAGVSMIRAVHVTELRSRIDALRSRASLAAYAWTDPTLSAASTFVRVVHIADLRAALADVYTTIGRAAPAYVDPALSTDVVIKRTHLTQLRSAVVAIE